MTKYSDAADKATNPRDARWRIKSSDDVVLSVLDSADLDKPPLLLVHGLSQSALSWQRQFNSTRLRERFRLVALDLRGHGQSQGALGATTGDGRALPPLHLARYNPGSDRAATSRLWSADIEAVIQGLSLRAPIMVGWSYGGVVLCDYMAAQRGLGAAAKVMLMNSTPAALPPGTPEVGADTIFTPAVPPSVFRTLDQDLTVLPPRASTASSVIEGMTAFVERAFSDTSAGRPPASRDELVAAVAYNLLLPPAARQAIISRDIDHRPFLTNLPEPDKQRIRVLCAGADAIMQTVNTAAQYRQCGLQTEIVPDEGHAWFARNPELFEETLLSWA